MDRPVLSIADNSSWQLNLLGTFELCRDGETVAVFGTRREEELFAYLAAGGGR